MKTLIHNLSMLILGVLVLAPVSGAADCPRSAQGSVVVNPPDLYSRDGRLKVNLFYHSSTDAIGRTLYCFLTADGKESPTLHVHPGDRLMVNLKNDLGAAEHAPSMAMGEGTLGVCGDAFMTPSSVNLHFHGGNLPPACHSDEVIRTLVNPGSTFKYDFVIPKDQPPGLYWYHPHVHGLSDPAVLGGASGAIVVEGIERVQPATANLREQVLVIRDQTLTRPTVWTDASQPSFDISLNYVPVPYPDYPPAIIHLAHGERQLWRVLNASADVIVDLQLQYDGVPQTVEVVALDGVPLASQYGTRPGSILEMKHVYLGPASRAEFIVTAPSPSVKSATLLTLGAETGPQGDITPPRPLASIRLEKMQSVHSHPTPPLSHSGASAENVRYGDLAGMKPDTQRTLFFSETPRTRSGDDDSQSFFITVAGVKPQAYDPASPPAIVTTQGMVEDWTVENRSPEVHEFHTHQLHFLLMARDGVAVPLEQQQYLDEVMVPYYTGVGPYPSVTVRMDFRGPLTGDFLYHCHILDHEDNGMMAVLRVLPRSAKK